MFVVRTTCDTLVFMPTHASPYQSLIDDAAVFPPGESPLPEAVTQHLHYRTTDLDAFVGPFVVGAGSLNDLANLATPARFPHDLAVSVVVPAGALEATLAALADLPRLVLAALEVKLAPAGAPGEQIEEVTKLHDRLAPQATLFIEVSRPTESPSQDWFDTVSAVARTGGRLKFRTGGVTTDAFPTDREMAIAITGAVSHRTPFKCTAGLHNAVRHRDPATGFEHHGFLNILMATADALTGADDLKVQNRLVERSGRILAADLESTSSPELLEARSMFLSYGSCSVYEPLADLEALGLLNLDYLETA